MALRTDVPVARITLGRGLPVDIHGFTRDDMGTPLVEIAGAVEWLQHLTPDQADKLAEALQRAARVAKGDERAPSALSDFLARKRE
ncbi:MAG TPA: hypothetical protein VEU47_18850 [Candidatus Cybelea sp.]|nr:hypothetical protein [Candidatus Cybelea sp.]